MLQRMKIGPRIKEARERQGFTQTSLGKRVGVSQPTVSDWESSRTEPTVENLRQLAVELQVYFEWLATGRGPSDFIPGVNEPATEYRVEAAPREDENNLLGIFRKLTEEKKAALLEFLTRWK